ncbi:MAG: bacterial Ig-like domain-containing protein [Bacteroidaceae bacterium]|nr:bacterial Ig-like domain-containing protein [Bacteroidaceae bacterium]
MKSIEVTYSSGTTKTLSSIAVKTAPTKTTYTEGENFDPAGLVITATYSDSDPEDIAYSGNESDFSFSPTLTTALTTSNTSVTITYGGKSTAQSITVNEKPKHTAYFSINGTINDAYDCTVTEGSAITFPTGLADINGKKFVGWMEGTISGTADTAPDFVTSATMGTADITYNAVYATQGEGGGSTTATYGFEDTDDATLWNIDGPNESTAYHNSGSKSGFINTNHTYITFNEKVNATNFSFAFTRTSTNNNYNVYIETSTDGTKWTAVKTYAMSSFASNGTFQTISHDFDGSEALYVRFHCYNTTASRYVDDVSITYNGGTTYSGYCTTVPTSGPTDASWSVEPAYVSVEVDKTATATISTDYDGTLSVSSNATGTATATISDKTITVTGVAAGTTTLTVTGAATSNFNAISKTINVTVTASSATTPAFAYFEETATINVGEILEAKDYCGTIASDAGFDDYSISTAVCSAIGAADGQKISDDYACIYSKVSFKKAGTYVVHVTAPAVAGKYTASEGYITVTVTGPTLYKVTIETPVNGTLIVKHGDDTVNSGDEFEEGEKLDITVTPNEGYKFRNWQAYDGTTHTYTSGTTWTMTASDVTISANFVELATYAISFSINGNIATQNLKEGAEVTVPTAEEVNAARPTGVTKVFTGWVTSESVNAEEEPSYVTPSASATGNATYYAVFANKEGEGEGEGGDYELVESALEDWTGEYLIVYNNTYAMNTHYGNQDANTYATYTDISSYYDNKTIQSNTTTDAIVYRATKTTKGYSLYSVSDESYLGITKGSTSTGSKLRWNTEYAEDACDWTIGINSIGNIGSNTLYIRWNNNSGSYRFAVYAKNGQQEIQLFKKSATTGGTTYSDFTTLPYLQLNEANTSIVELADAPCDKVEVTRALKAGNWNTFCLPFSLNEEEIESQLGSDAEVKALSTFDVNDEGTTLILNFGDASEIAAGQPYMVRVQEAVSTITAEGKTINTVTAPVQEFSNELYNCNFHGNYYYLEGTKNGYVPHSTFIISNNLFYLVNSNVKMKGFRGYIEATEKATGAPVKAMSFTTDAVVTGTLGIQYEGLEDGCIYNLQGLRQSKLQKGINIVNGKKVLR